LLFGLATLLAPLGLSQKVAPPAPAPAAQTQGWYNVNLATSAFYWQSLLPGTPLTPVAGALESKGPWTIDTNHMEFGLLVGPAVTWNDGTHGGIAPPLDLRRAHVHLNFDLEEHTTGGEQSLQQMNAQVVFWVQVKLWTEWSGNPVRYANYIWNENLRDYAAAKSPKKTKVLDLTVSLNDWSCLGRQRRDVRTEIDPTGNTKFMGSASIYSCALTQAEFEQSLADPHDDMGILIIVGGKQFGATPPPPVWNTTWGDPLKPQRVLGDSRLLLREFTITKK
jgi:hypothetical protein